MTCKLQHKDWFRLLAELKRICQFVLQSIDQCIKELSCAVSDWVSVSSSLALPLPAHLEA